MKIVSVVGARPQFVKAAVVSRAIAAWNAAHGGTLVHTGQHHDANMSDVFFRELGLLAPQHHLGVAGGPHGEMTGRMLVQLEPVLAAESPDWVVVYGDTNSTLAGALSAATLRLPVAHVESGLRSHNRAMPEELNRVVTDHVADLLFVPTPAAAANLECEGIARDRVLLVGDVMYEAARHHGRTATPSAAIARLIEELGEGFLVATTHRAENTDDPSRLSAILTALAEISVRRAVVLPLHPRTRARLGEWRPPPSLRVMEPCGYLDMISLLRACAGVLTDSGGLQKEAFFLGKPCVTLREETEWVELVDLGVNAIAGTDSKAIVQAWQALCGRRLDWSARPYGAGDAGGRIVAALRVE